MSAFRPLVRNRGRTTLSTRRRPGMDRARPKRHPGEEGATDVASDMDKLRQDLAYAIRQLERAPGFAAVAILTLGLAIGANTAIFSIVDAILLKPLPYESSDRLVRIVENVPADESFSGAPERTTNMSP